MKPRPSALLPLFAVPAAPAKFDRRVLKGEPPMTGWTNPTGHAPAPLG